MSVAAHSASPSPASPRRRRHWRKSKSFQNMADSIAETCQLFLEAIAFAARAHQGQLRKDGQTPYVSHVFRVCLVLREVFGVADLRVLTAAVLHDTLEDTTTDFDDLAEQFGADVAAWVAALSKDKREPHDVREEAYCRR